MNLSESQTSMLLRNESFSFLKRGLKFPPLLIQIRLPSKINTVSIQSLVKKVLLLNSAACSKLHQGWIQRFFYIDFFISESTISWYVKQVEFFQSDVTWYKALKTDTGFDVQLLESDERIKITTKNNNIEHTLELKNVQGDDEGIYVIKGPFSKIPVFLRLRIVVLE